MDISIIVPTMNRPGLLLRLVEYFNVLNFKGKILIGDSSDKEVYSETKSALENYLNKLDICHIHLPNRSVAAAVLDMNEYLTTSYACLIPDDDFLVPQTIKNCIEFLDEHDDYVAAHGVGVLIACSSGDSGNIESVGYYSQTVSEDSKSSIRLCEHLKNYSVTLFSVHRTEVWRKMFIDTPVPEKNTLSCDSSFRDELLPCCLSVAYGKVKQINGLYLVRQVHKERYLLPGWYQWITDEKWFPSFLWFRNKITTVISEVDNISMKDAQVTFDMGFEMYLQKTFEPSVPESLLWRIRNIIKRGIPLAGLAMLRRFRSKLLTEKISLESLMDDSSPYNMDFIPIYNIVTAKKNDTST